MKRFSLRNKLFLFIVSLIVVQTLVSAGVYYSSTSSALQTRFNELQENTISTIGNNLDSNLSHINWCLDFAFSSANLQAYLKNTNFNSFGMEYYHATKAISSIMDNLAFNEPYLRMIFVIPNQTQRAIKITNTDFADVYDLNLFEKAYQLQETTELNGKINYIGMINIVGHTNVNYFVAARVIKDIITDVPSNNVLGVVYMFFSTDMITDAYANMKLDPKAQVSVYNPDRSVLSNMGIRTY